MATGFYLSWTDRKNRAADTTIGTIESLLEASAVASNLQRLNGYSRVDVVAVEEETVILSATDHGLEGLEALDPEIRQEILWR